MRTHSVLGATAVLGRAPESKQTQAQSMHMGSGALSTICLRAPGRSSAQGSTPSFTLCLALAMVSTNGRSRVSVRCSLQVLSALAIVASASAALQAQSSGQSVVPGYTPPAGLWGGNAGQVAGWANSPSILDLVDATTPTLNRLGARRYARDTADAADGMAMPGFGRPGSDFAISNAGSHPDKDGYSYPAGDALTPAMQDLDSRGATGDDGGGGFTVSNAGLIFGTAPSTNHFYETSSWENDDSQGTPNSPSIGDGTIGQTLDTPHLQFFSDPVLAITATPEPGSLALLFTGFLVIGGVTMVRRRPQRA